MALRYDTIKWLLESPYFVSSPEWHLKDDAPEELKKRFEEFMKPSSDGRI